MSYQQVKTPKFYVNVLEWLHSTGQENYLPNIYKTNPTNGVKGEDFEGGLSEDGLTWNAGEINTHNSLHEEFFVAVLGHQLGGRKAIIFIDGVKLESGESEDVVNFQDDTNPEHDGFSICKVNKSDFEKIEFTLQKNYEGSYSDESPVSSCVIGNFYEMAHSPDLNLTMSIEYGGTKTIETKGGSTLSNSYWKKQPNWGNGFPAWHIDASTPELAPLAFSGRRIWNLSFSYLDQEDLLPKISSLTAYGSGIDFDYSREQSFLHSSGNSNFFSEVLHKSVGLPFIFQPDKDFNNFAICMFDQNSFQFKKITDSMYNISLTIREVW